MGHQVSCYLPFAQVDELDELAHAAGTSRSALLRNIVEEWLKVPSTETNDLPVLQLDGTASSSAASDVCLQRISLRGERGVPRELCGIPGLVG